MKKTESSKKLVLVIPTFNEAENIEKTIKVILNSLPQNSTWNFHILVVDGNSPDGTASIVRKRISEFSNLHLLVEKEKAGLGAAYIKGMDYAFDEMHADYVLEFDADLQHDPVIIKDMLNKIEDGYDLVTGTRYRKGGGIPDTWKFHRKFLSKGGNLFIRLLFLNNKITDWTSGYSVFSKKVYSTVRPNLSLEKGYTFQISLKKNTIDNKFKVAEVPYVFRDREKGESKLGPEFLVRALTFVIKTRIDDALKSSFIKVCIVGGIGSVVQILAFRFLRENFYFIIAHNLSIEIAILSNFTLNNLFSFREHQISGLLNLVKKFVAFNFVSFGSILIQNVVMIGGVYLLNIQCSVAADCYQKDLLNILGILLGLVSNFYLYKKFIWKVKIK